MDETVDLVDEDDQVLGVATKEECHRKGLLHRISAIYVVSKRGVLLQRRSSAKMGTPGRLDHSAAGHVASGESYEEAATRELEEELGITAEVYPIGVAMEHTERRHSVTDHLFKVFVCDHEGPFKLQDEEVQDVEVLSLADIRARMTGHPDEFTGGIFVTFPVLERYLKVGSRG